MLPKMRISKIKVQNEERKFLRFDMNFCILTLHAELLYFQGTGSGYQGHLWYLV